MNRADRRRHKVKEPTVPEEVLTLARAWRCPDCGGRPQRPQWSDDLGQWVVGVECSTQCPRLTGATGPARDTMAAAVDAVAAAYPDRDLEFTITDHRAPVEELPR